MVCSATMRPEHTQPCRSTAIELISSDVLSRLWCELRSADERSRSMNVDERKRLKQRVPRCLGGSVCRDRLRLRAQVLA